MLRTTKGAILSRRLLSTSRVDGNNNLQEELFRAIETQPLTEVQKIYARLSGAKDFLVRSTGNRYDRNRGNNALHSAIEFGRYDTAKWLIEEHSDLLVKENAIGVPPWVNLLIYFHKSFNGPKYVDLIKTVLCSTSIEKSFYKTSDKAVAKKHHEFVCALHLEGNNNKAFKILEENKGSLYWQDPFRFTPLHYIAARGKPEDLARYSDLLSVEKTSREIVTLFNMRDINGNNPLHIAVPNASTKTIEELIIMFRKTAKNRTVDVLNYIEQPNNYGYDPFKIAISIGHRETLATLFKYGYNVKKPTYVVVSEDTQNGHTKVRREPALLTTLLWLHEDNVAYRNIEWLFRHGVSIYDCFSREEVHDLDRGKTIKDIDSLFGDELTVNLEQIAAHLGFKKSAKFLSANGVISKEIPLSTDKLTPFVFNYCLNSAKSTSSSSKSDSRVPFLPRDLNDFLENHSVDPNHSNFCTDFYKALSATIFRGNFEIFRTLVDFYPNLVFDPNRLIMIPYENRSTPIYVTALHLAVMYGNNSYSNESIRQRFDRNKIINYLLTPNCFDVPVSFVDAKDHSSRTAFYMAAKHGYLDAIKLIAQFYDKPSLSGTKKMEWSDELKKARKIAEDFNRLDVVRYIDSKLKENASKEPLFRRTSLVFQGGGVRGVAYPGALLELYGNGYIHQVITDQELEYEKLQRGYYVKAKGSEKIEVIVIHKKGHVDSRETIELNLSDEVLGKSTQKGITIREEIKNLLSEIRSNEIGKFSHEFSSMISSLCKHNLYHVGTVGGASAGAITALLVAFGYSPLEIEKIVREQNFVRLLDEVRKDGTIFYGGKATGHRARNELQEFFKERSWFSYLRHGFSRSTVPTLFRVGYFLKKDKGLFKGDELREELDNYIDKKVGIKNCTFRELHLLARDNPRFKELYVVALDLKNRKTQVFSHEYTPDVIISDAVRCSMSIPGVFVPHSLYVKTNDARRLDVSQGESLFVDGGVFDNYPVFLFRLDSTLGFRLLEPKLWEKYMPGRSKDAKSTNIVTLTDHVKPLILGIFSKQESDFENRSEDGDTVLINTKDIDSVDFNITEENKQKLIDSGRHAASHYITSSIRPLLFMSREICRADDTTGSPVGRSENREDAGGGEKLSTSANRPKKP